MSALGQQHMVDMATVTAPPFHKAQQSAIFSRVASVNELSVCINAHEITRFLVAVAPCHQIPVILLGPIEKTVIPCGNHDLRGTCLDVTHCTWHVVIVKAALEWIKRADLVFSTINEGGRLKTVLVFLVLWFVWQAKVLTTTTTIMVEVAASNKS